MLEKKHNSEERDEPCERYRWIDNQGRDGETLVELTREMCEILANEPIKFEDSRCFYRLCIDMPHDFQKLHVRKDWGQVDFLSAIISYGALVKKQLQSFPDWINTDYQWMYGSESITDLLSKQ